MKITEKTYKALVLSFIPEASKYLDFKTALAEIFKNIKSLGRSIFFRRLFLFFLDIFLPIFALKLKPFHTLTREEREKVLEKLENHTFVIGRLLYMIAKGLALITFYSSPQGREFVGYKPECAIKEE